MQLYWSVYMYICLKSKNDTKLQGFLRNQFGYQYRLFPNDKLLTTALPLEALVLLFPFKYD